MWVMSRYGDGKGKDQERVELWWQMMDADGSDFLEFDEFKLLPRIVHAPIERVPRETPDPTPLVPGLYNLLNATSLASCFYNEELAAISSADTAATLAAMSPADKSSTLADMSPVDRASLKEWELSPQPLPWGPVSTWIAFLDMCGYSVFLEVLTVLSVLWGLATSTSDVCASSVELGLEIAFTIIFLLDVVLRLFSEMRAYSKFHYLHNKYAWLDVLSTGLMLWGVVSCLEGGKMNDTLRSMVGIVRAIRCFRLTHSIKPLQKICSVSTSMIQLIMPQATLFIAVYYCYSVAGMGLYAGATTRTLAAGGPGRWSTTPWNNTAYGAASQADGYYYDLNFDTLGNSMITLFVCMVQNNWYVVVDGFVQTNSANSKFFFLSFNVMVVIVMMNIFVGNVLLLYEMLEPKSGEDSSEAVKKEYKMIENRLQTSTFKETWRVKQQLKDNSILFKSTGEDDFSGGGGVGDKEKEQTAAILNWCPSCIFVQNQNGLYSFCNSTYAALLGLEADDIIDQYDLSDTHNQRRLKKLRCERRKEVLNNLSMTHKGREKIVDCEGRTRVFEAHSRAIEQVQGGKGVITYLQELHGHDYLHDLHRHSSIRAMRAILRYMLEGDVSVEGRCIDVWRTDMRFAGRSGQELFSRKQLEAIPNIAPELNKRDEEPVDAVEIARPTSFAEIGQQVRLNREMSAAAQPHISSNTSNFPNTKISEDDVSEAGMVIMHGDQVWADFTPIEENSPTPQPAQIEENPMQYPSAPPLTATQTQRAQAGKAKEAKQSGNVEPSVIKYRWQPEPSA